MRSILHSRRRLLLGLAALAAAIPTLAHAQTGPFRPGDFSVSNQAWNSVANSPSDTANIAVTRAIYIGAAAVCTLTIVPNGSSTSVAFANLQPGEILPVQAIKIMATGTTCTGIVVLY